MCLIVYCACMAFDQRRSAKVDTRRACRAPPVVLLLLQAGQPPDVWLQLLERCAEDKACMPSIIQGYPQQQQDVTDLQQQLTLTQQDNARLQQQVTYLQQQLASRQQAQAQQQHHA